VRLIGFATLRKEFYARSVRIKPAPEQCSR